MRQVIVLASFGVADAEQRAKCLDTIARDTAETFPGFGVRQVYTSAFIRKRLEKEGQHVPSLEECLESLRREGAEQVLIQPTHLTPGEEYEKKILDPAKAWASAFRALGIGQPVFYGGEDYAIGLEAAIAGCAANAGEELVFMGHGSPHQHNPAYERLQAVADDRGWSVHIGVLEESDWPNFRDVARRLKAKNARGVLLRPFLLAGGMHVQKDMAGDQESSWLRRLEQEGFPVRVDARGFGHFAAFRKQYLRHIHLAMEGLAFSPDSAILS